MMGKDAVLYVIIYNLISYILLYDNILKYHPYIQYMSK